MYFDTKQVVLVARVVLILSSLNSEILLYQ